MGHSGHRVGRTASPVTATTDFLAQDILNKCGRLVPTHILPPEGPAKTVRRWQTVTIASGHVDLGREPINLPGGWLAGDRYTPIATKFCSAAKSRDGPKAAMSRRSNRCSCRRRRRRCDRPQENGRHRKDRSSDRLAAG